MSARASVRLPWRMLHTSIARHVSSFDTALPVRRRRSRTRSSSASSSARVRLTVVLRGRAAGGTPATLPNGTRADRARRPERLDSVLPGTGPPPGTAVGIEAAGDGLGEPSEVSAGSGLIGHRPAVLHRRAGQDVRGRRADGARQAWERSGGPWNTRIPVLSPESGGTGQAKPKTACAPGVRHRRQRRERQRNETVHRQNVARRRCLHHRPAQQATTRDRGRQARRAQTRSRYAVCHAKRHHVEHIHIKGDHRFPVVFHVTEPSLATCQQQEGGQALVRNRQKAVVRVRCQGVASRLARKWAAMGAADWAPKPPSSTMTAKATLPR